MRSTRVVGRRMARAIARILIISILGSTTALAQQVAFAPAPAVTPSEVDPEPVSVSLLVGRSTVINVGTPITRVSLTSSDVADALVTSSSQLLINGKTPGTISMFVWARSGGIQRYEVAVQRDLARLDGQLKQLFPNEPIQALSSGRQIVLSGTVSTKDVLDRVIAVSAGFVEKRDDVVSLLQVPPAGRPRQVLLRVRFAEVSRSALTELGLSLFTGPTGIRNTLGRVTTQQFSAPGFNGIEWSKDSAEFGAPVTSASGSFTFSDFLNFFVLSERYDLGALVRALQTRGLFESLAEPNLVAESGTEASFLAGGEFPIPVAQGSGANIGISVQFKEFGIRLGFLPTVNGDRVHLKVRPEVSTLDFANAVTLSGFRIPALTTRRTETQIELQDGQTFAIAGLMNNSMTSTMQKIPGIGDIPILGYLFRSKAARKEQTELVVIITPQILPADSPGVTTELPRLQDPFLPRLQERETIPVPPPAFPYPAGRPGALNQAPEGAVPGVPARALTADERRALEQTLRNERAAQEQAAREARIAQEQAAREQALAEKAQQAERQRMQEEERAMREAQAQVQAEVAKVAAKEAEEQRRRDEVVRQQQDKLAREQAKRDAEAAKRAEEEARRQAQQAKREAEAERKRQEAIAAAQAKLKAAEQAYQAELQRRGTSETR